MSAGVAGQTGQGARLCDVCGLPLPPREPGALGPPRLRHPECPRPCGRGRRARGVRARAIHAKRLAKRDLAVSRALYPEAAHLPPIPATRGDCPEERPCPHVRCRYHLYLDVLPKRGSIKVNFPDLEVEDMAESCALDVADRGGATLEQCGQLLNLTRERTRQIEAQVLALTSESRALGELAEDEGRKLVRRLPLVGLDGPDEDDPDLDDDEEDDDG